MYAIFAIPFNSVLQKGCKRIIIEDSRYIFENNEKYNVLIYL